MQIIIRNSAGEVFETSLAAFLDESELDADERADILDALDGDLTYRAGGGAAPEWSVERAPHPIGPAIIFPGC